MHIIVFALQFNGGVWREQKHDCSPEEASTIIDIALARAKERLRYWIPQPSDYLAGASGMFNVELGAEEKPAEGDTLVFGVDIDDDALRHTMVREDLPATR